MVELVAGLHDFHFQRPGWLLALIPALALAWLLHRRRRDAGSWRNVIAAELAPYLLDSGDSGAPPRLWLWAAIAWLLICTALAGPSWHKLPLPIYTRETPLVILLDLSPSMLARDIKPDRLTRLRLKLIDLLNARKEGSTALIAYAGDSHVVSPLTDDAATIVALLPALHPNIMPIAGSRPDTALVKGLELLANAGHSRGDLLLATDGISAKAAAAMDSFLAAHPGFALSVLGVGSEPGAPIPQSGGGFVKNRAGDMVIARLDVNQLATFANDHGGRYATLGADNADIRYLTEPLYRLPGSDAKAADRTFDTWQDNGFWLVLPGLPLILLAFRRRLLAALLLAPLMANPGKAQAFDWGDLWQNPNQQGARALARGEPGQAQQLFTTPAWQGTAAYRAGDFAAAVKLFAEDPSADGFYNRGNALAKAGQLDAAIAAYDEALKLNPGMAAAKANRKLVEDLLKQQQPPAEDNSDAGKDAESQQQQKPGEQGSRKPADKDGDNDSKSDPDQQQNPPSADSKATGEPEKPSTGNDNDGTKPADANNAGTDQTTAAETAAEPKAADQAATAQKRAGDSPLSTEQQQTLEQWLRRIPDDPSGLLRRKFDYESRRPHGQHSRESVPDEEL